MFLVEFVRKYQHSSYENQLPIILVFQSMKRREPRRTAETVARLQIPFAAEDEAVHVISQQSPRLGT